MANDDLHLSANDGSRLLNDHVTLGDQSTSGVVSHVVQLKLTSGAVDLTLNPTYCDNVRVDTGDKPSNGRCEKMKLDFPQDVNSSTSEWNFVGHFHLGGVSEFTSYTRNIVMDTNGFVGCLGVGIGLFIVMINTLTLPWSGKFLLRKRCFALKKKKMLLLFTLYLFSIV